MDLPIVSADSHLMQILTAHADDLLAERRSVSGLQSMVVNQLVDLLPSGQSRDAAVAQRLQDQSDSLAAACGPAVDADIGGSAREFGLRSGQRQ